MLEYLTGVLSGLLFAVLIVLILVYKYLLDTPDSSGKSKFQKQIENKEFDNFNPNIQKEVFSDEAVSGNQIVCFYIFLHCLHFCV